MKRSIVAGTASVALALTAAVPAYAENTWLYRNCPSGEIVGAGSTRVLYSGTETFHAYYQGTKRQVLRHSYGRLMVSTSGFLNWADVNYVSDGDLSSVSTGCG